MDDTQSFTARRSAASNLPTFQLPPPDISKYPYAQGSHAPLSAAQGANNVLTPPVALPTDGPVSPLSAGGGSASSQGGPPYNPMGYWPTPQHQHQQQQQQQYPFSPAPPGPSPYAQNQNSMYMGRQLYSPSMSYPQQQQRGANAPASDEPPYQQLSLPPFASGAGGQANLPNLSQQQQQQQQQMSNAMANPQQSSQPPQQSSSHAPENYGPRPPPTPTYSYTSSTPQQSSFPAYTQPSPTQQQQQHHHQQQPSAAAPQQPRISPLATHQHQQHPSSMHPPAGSGYAPRPYGSGGYALPQLSGGGGGPIMSNVHSPGNQMSLVGGGGMGMPAGYGQAHHALYGATPGGLNDRPFKCDQCPQSFNRNHDLKRHKRIHLAVKPYPCSECEKSFSRKDALKRHVLVKGCGKPGGGGQQGQLAAQRQMETVEKEGMSDSTEGSPGRGEFVKKEI